MFSRRIWLLTIAGTLLTVGTGVAAINRHVTALHQFDNGGGVRPGTSAYVTVGLAAWKDYQKWVGLRGRVQCSYFDVKTNKWVRNGYLETYSVRYVGKVPYATARFRFAVPSYQPRNRDLLVSFEYLGSASYRPSAISGMVKVK